MANTLTNILPKVLARGLMSLRTRCIMPRLVNSDYGTEASKKGSTIDIPVPVAVGTTAVSPSNVLVAPTDLTPGVVQVSLDQWYQNNPIGLTDKELCEIDANEHFLPMQLEEAIKALATVVNQHIIGKYTGTARGVYGVAGDNYGTDPFGSTQGVSGATLARKVLNQQLCPKTDRRGVVDFAAEANMLDLAAFSDAEKIMSAVVKMEGEIGRKYAIDWVADDDVPTHTAGTLEAAGTAVSTNVAGNSYATITLTGGTGETLLLGDIISFAGDSQTYCVIAGTTGDYSEGVYTFGSDPDTVVVSVVPDIQVSVSGAAVTKGDSHVVNMAFHRDAFAFATRPLLDVSQDFSLGSKMLSMQDPVTGLILRLEVSRQHKQTVWEYDLLWGADLIRPEFATRIIGKSG